VLSICRPNPLLSDAMSPLAICETSPITNTGRSAITGLRKMRRSRARMSAIVAKATIFAAVWPAFCWSTYWAALPVRPASRSLPLVSDEISWRNACTASTCTAESCPSAFGIWTPMSPTRRFFETTAGSTVATARRWWETIAFRARSRSDTSAAESGRPSWRSTTTSAAGIAASGNARFWRFDACTDW
jgi:hypothetical protein